MASSAASAQIRSANVFVLKGRTGTMKVTYYPDAPGPLVEGLTPGALFEYDGPEGRLSFRSAQISRQDTPSGQLLSVVLKPQFHLGAIALSLFLPPVSVDSDGQQAFTTCGVKTRHIGLAQTSGAQITYEMERFDGEARVESMPR